MRYTLVVGVTPLDDYNNVQDLYDIASILASKGIKDMYGIDNLTDELMALDQA